MSRGLIASRQQSAQPPTAAALIALLAHGAVVTGALLGTPRPDDPPHTIPTVLLPWRQPRAPTQRAATPAPTPPSPLVDSFAAPQEIHTDLPLIDGTRPFDPKQWSPRPTVEVSGDPGDSGDAWTSALVEEPPVLLAGRAPSYPEALRAAGIIGRVVVQAVIDTLGRAEPGARVVESTHARFEPSALDYVRGAVFRPGRVHGRAVRVLIRLPVDFRLTDGY